MKFPITILFLALLLLCGTILKASGKSKKLIRLEVKAKPANAEARKDLHILPNLFLLNTPPF